MSMIGRWVELNRAELVAGFRAASPRGTAWLVGRMAPTLARVALEVSARALAPMAVPFLESVLAAEGLMDAGWAARARAVLALFSAPAGELHPATARALMEVAPGLLDPPAFGDPSAAVFAPAVAIPAPPEDPAR